MFEAAARELLSADGAERAAEVLLDGMLADSSRRAEESKAADRSEGRRKRGVGRPEEPGCPGCGRSALPNSRAAWEEYSTAAADLCPWPDALGQAALGGLSGANGAQWVLKALWFLPQTEQRCW